MGFTVDDPEEFPMDGAVIVRGDNDVIGNICSCRYSQALEKPFGMALVDESLSGKGSKLEFFQDGMNIKDRIRATVCDTPFYDPRGLKLKA